MKKFLPVILGVLAALLSAGMIYFRKDFGNVEVVKNVAQIGMPLLLGIVFGVLPRDAKRKIFGLTLGLLTFFIVLSFLEPFAFEYWVTQTTPAGSIYSRYDMDALYPWLGIFIVLIAFIVGLVVVLTQDVIYKAMHRNVPSNRTKR